MLSYPWPEFIAAPTENHRCDRAYLQRIQHLGPRHRQVGANRHAIIEDTRIIDTAASAINATSSSNLWTSALERLRSAPDSLRAALPNGASKPRKLALTHVYVTKSPRHLGKEFNWKTAFVIPNLSGSDPNGERRLDFVRSRRRWAASRAIQAIATEGAMFVFSRFKTAARVTAVIGLLFAATAAQPARALDQVKYTLTWLPVGMYSYFAAGIKEGFFKEQGIDLTVDRGFGSNDVVTKMSSGVYDVGDVDTGALISGRMKNQAPVKCIAASVTLSPHALIVRTDSGIDTFKDLEGRRLGTQPGNAMLVYFPIIARKNHIDVSKINMVNVDSAAMASLLVTGKIDAAAFFSTNLYGLNQMAQKVGAELKALSFADNGLQFYGSCIGANETAIAEKPDLLKRLVAAIMKSQEWTRKHPEQAARHHVAMYPDVPYDAAVAELKYAMEHVYFNDVTAADGHGIITKPRMQQTYDTIAEAQGFDPKADVTAFYVTDFMPMK